MFKILKFILIATVVFLLFGFIAKNNGTVEINWLDYQIKTSIATFIVILAVSFYLVSNIFNIKKIFKRRRKNKKYNKKK
jgi:uncharacterized integral membrane protein